MTSRAERHALYYPFHLCHERTLERLLKDYASVHFRDYMALQLTLMAGTTAYADRMGDYYPDLLRSGRIVQGYSVSGSLDLTIGATIDHDMADATWRSLFHKALSEDRRFQRGLLNVSHGMRIGDTMVPGPAALLHLIEAFRIHEPYSIESVRDLSHSPKGLSNGCEYEYGLALVKTAASLAYTVDLAIKQELEAVTDSTPYHQLLERTCVRDDIHLNNRLLKRDDY